MKKDVKQKNKKYYHDCGKGLKEKDPRILWEKIRGYPSYLYQSKRITDTKKEIVALNLKGKVLDAACGSGYILSALPKGSVGIEINPKHVANAKKIAPYSRVLKGDIEHIPFPDNSFSAVLATEIFEHIPYQKSVIAEMWRVLKRNGFFITTVPTQNFLWKIRFLASSMSKTEPFCFSFSKENLFSIFSDHKYEIKELKKIAFGLNYLLILKKRE
ncbi:MAG: class I SAM-dependent methyltransferase [Candidatus Levybacteria bacterium]|nr:class I SAM-dependent methyltransferase [Candidatus Levybacteria bacterium]